MESRIVLGNTDRPLPFLLLNSDDHRTGVPNLTPQVELWKPDGQGWRTPHGAVSERGNGWYQVAPDATDAGVRGPLILHATGVGCDPFDIAYQVVETLAAQPLVQYRAGDLLPFLLVRDSDHLTGAIGLAPDVTLAPTGGPFAPPAATMSGLGYGWFPFAGNFDIRPQIRVDASAVEGLGYGWYTVEVDEADVAAAGPLLLHAEADGADPVDVRFDVSPAPAAVDGLMGAIKRIFLADERLVPFGGRAFNSFGPANPPLPYVIVSDMGAMPEKLTSDSRYMKYRVGMRVWHAGAADVSGYAALIYAAFIDAPLVFDGGKASKFEVVAIHEGSAAKAARNTSIATQAFPYAAGAAGRYFFDIEFVTRIRFPRVAPAA